MPQLSELGAQKLQSAAVVVYVAADPPNLPPYSIYQNDNTADNSNLDPTLLNTGLKPWTPPAAPSGAMPNQPPYLPAGPDILPGFNTSRAPPTQLSRTGNCVLDGLAEAGLITLLKSLNYTGLNTTFKGYATATGNVTILAPTDEAFATWTGSLRYLPSTTLKSILQYHVLPGACLESPLLAAGPFWAGCALLLALVAAASAGH